MYQCILFRRQFSLMLTVTVTPTFLSAELAVAFSISRTANEFKTP